MDRNRPGRNRGLLFSVVFHAFNYGVLMGALFVAGLASNLLVRRQMATLRDEGDDRQFATTLVLRREVPYGFDEGLISFEDGWMVYAGRRCAFSLGAGDVRVVTRGKDRLKIAFDGPAGERTAEFDLASSEAFRQASLEWVEADRTSPGAVFPPARPAATAPSLGRALVGGTATIAGVVALAHVLRGDRSGFEGALAALLLLLWITIVYARDLRAVLRRIERDEPEVLPFFSRPLGRGRRRTSLPPADGAVE